MSGGLGLTWLQLSEHGFEARFVARLLAREVERNRGVLAELPNDTTTMTRLAKVEHLLAKLPALPAQPAA